MQKMLLKFWSLHTKRLYARNQLKLNIKRRMDLKNLLIKLLGGYTQEEIDNTPHGREKKAVLLEREIYSEKREDCEKLKQKQRQLGLFFLAFTDGAHNYNMNNSDLFSLKCREYFRQLRLYSQYTQEYIALEDELFNRFYELLNISLCSIFWENSFSDEHYEKAIEITNEINAYYFQNARGDNVYLFKSSMPTLESIKLNICQD